MTQLAKSYTKVHYEFRPAKQVERRMLLHTFQSMIKIGFPIDEYQYTGLGSIYFIDFILFHRYLGIKKFLSVEVVQDIEKRVKFNKPFKCVVVEIGNILDYIPTLSPDKKHILWLDFDKILSEEMLNAVCMSSAQLSPGSVLLVTVDVEPPGRPEDGPENWNPESWMNHFLEEADEYLWPKPKKSEFVLDKLIQVNMQLLKNAIAAGLASREIDFHPLFNFIYADGHRMLSFGGVICSEDESRKLKSLNGKELFFLRNSKQNIPYEIVVPKVTRKERLYLDSNMPCKTGWLPSDFELSREEVEAYKEIYRYYPAYTEMLL